MHIALGKTQETGRIPWDVFWALMGFPSWPLLPSAVGRTLEWPAGKERGPGAPAPDPAPEARLPHLGALEVAHWGLRWPWIPGSAPWQGVSPLWARASAHRRSRSCCLLAVSIRGPGKGLPCAGEAWCTANTSGVLVVSRLGQGPGPGGTHEQLAAPSPSPG